MSALKNQIIRLAHENLSLREHLLPLLKSASGLRLHDMDNAESLLDGFRRVSKVWSSESEAERALNRHLASFGLKVYKIKNLPPQQGGEWQQWGLSTEDDEVVEDHINVFYRPGHRPGWVSFQVSL